MNNDEYLKMESRIWGSEATKMLKQADLSVGERYLIRKWAFGLNQHCLNTDMQNSQYGGVTSQHPEQIYKSLKSSSKEFGKQFFSKE